MCGKQNDTINSVVMERQLYYLCIGIDPSENIAIAFADLLFFVHAQGFHIKRWKPGFQLKLLFFWHLDQILF